MERAKRYIIEPGKPSKELVECKDCELYHTTHCPMSTPTRDDGYCHEEIRKTKTNLKHASEERKRRNE